MSLDSHSLDRLRQLGRQLPDTLPSPKISTKTNSKQTAKNKRHQVELEEDPHKLFHSLMDISPDGNVPAHLISRLKETELTKRIEPSQSPHPNNSKDISNSRQNRKINENEDDLYRSFMHLLSEEDD
tara:strand:- start:1718 stop:2098 length:381 start_codon:yes stop_codon:yes gene_type:complete